MPTLHVPITFLSLLFAFHVSNPHFVSCSSNELHVKPFKITRDGLDKLSSKMKAEIALHGILLWVSMGFLAPLGILVIRMSHREEGVRRKVFFYIHLVLQVLSVLLATAGAVMSLKSFENSFNNSHQRVGLALYCSIWVQSLIGFMRPSSGNRRRSTWYFVHWMLGTIITLVGIINIYTGLNAYKKKLSTTNTRIWTILFTAQVSFMAFFYLFQDKWDYMQKQGVILDQEQHQLEISNSPNIITNNNHSQSTHGKVLVPEQCAKRNALKNLFD